MKRKIAYLLLLSIMVSACDLGPSSSPNLDNSSTTLVDDQSSDQPTTQNPITDDPTTQIPVTEDPTTQDPSPVTEDPTTPTPVTENPTTQNPTTQNPTTQNPTTQNPTTQNPTTQNPTTQNPTTQNPTTNIPSTTTPTTPSTNPSTGTGGGGSEPADTYGGNYYDSVSDSLRGASLNSALKTVTSSGFVDKSYDSLNQIYPYSDVVDGKMVMFYTGTKRTFTGTSLPSKTNKEHVWPQSSYGGDATGGAGSDAHNIFPCDSQLNNIRSNIYFDEMNQNSSNRVYEGGSSGSYGENGGNLDYGTPGDLDSYNYTNKSSAFYPKKGYRGMAARAILYVSARYGHNLVEQNGQTSTGDKKMGRLSTLLKWHLEEPVTDFEINRNNVIFEKWHKNRNPFIDKPKYACRIWENTNATTKSICEQYSTPVTEVPVTGINITSYTQEVGVNESIQFSATVTPVDATNKTVEWRSSNTSIATVDQYAGLVMGRAEGTVTITAYSSQNPDIKKDVTITIVDKGVEPPPIPTGPISFNAAGIDGMSLTAKSSGTFVKENITFTYADTRNYSSTVVTNALFIYNGGALYNSTSLGSIEKIVVQYSEEGSETAHQGYSFASSEITSKPSSFSTTLTTSPKGETVTITSPSTSLGFFRIDVSNKNLQISNITIYMH